MTATERLRAMLDERGVEWAVPDEVWNQNSITYWQVGSIKWVAFENENNTLWLNCNSVTDITPEQAIAATLGSCNCTNDCSNSERMGTCEQEEGGWSTEGDHARVWLTCGHDCMVETVADLPNFCPVCGAKVVTDD